jgi:EAL domain-containing protein (putative c-di-GMP-specific phosphodiesterase class I)
MSYAGEARVAAALDSACLVRALDVMRQQRDRLPTVVNLGAAALSDQGIRRWVGGYRQDPRNGAIVLEFSEAVLLSDVEAAEALAQQAHARGLMLGIKHFGLHANALALLRRLRPAHVKFSVTLTREALLNPDSGAYVRSLAGIASALSITPLAVAVESLSELQALHDLGMRGAQGAAIAREQMLRPQT